MEKGRTVQEFVEDLLSDGREPKEILVVAANTYWKLDIEEIRKIIKSFSGKFKKDFQIIDEKDDNISKETKIKDIGKDKK